LVVGPVMAHYGNGGIAPDEAAAGQLIVAGADNWESDLARCLTAKSGYRSDLETETLVAHTLRGSGFDASEDGTGRGTPLVAVAFSSKDHGADASVDLSPTLRAGGFVGSHANGGVPPAIAFVEQETIPLDLRQISRGETNTNNRAEGTSGGPPGTGVGEAGDPAFAVTPRGQAVAVALPINMQENQNALGVGPPGHPMYALAATKEHAIAVGMMTPDEEHAAIRALTGDDVADPVTASEGRTYSHEGTNNFRLHNVVAVPLQEVDCPRESPKNGIGIGEAGDPMFTLQAAHQHGIAVETAEEPEAFQCHGSNIGPLGTLRKGNGHVTGGVPFIVNAAESTAKESHARETETARCLDRTGGFAANQGGTVVAVALRGREGGATAEVGDDQSHALRASQGGGDKQYVLFDEVQITSPDNRSNPQPGDPAPTLAASSQLRIAMNLSDDPAILEGDGTADQANARKTLLALRRQVGAEAFQEWSLGVLASVLPPQVLRSEVHGGGLRREASQAELELVDSALSREEAVSTGSVRVVWTAGRDRCPPSEWQLEGQFARELGADLSRLPQQGTPPAWFLYGMWEASEGLGLLRQALHTLQALGRPAGGEGKSAPPSMRIRRLMPVETERLQGIPDNYTLVPYPQVSPELGPDGGAKVRLAADGPRYQAIGNSYAVPVVRKIGERVALVETLLAKGVWQS
jgi:site-specific DNA-cytosine methylase